MKDRSPTPLGCVGLVIFFAAQVAVMLAVLWLAHDYLAPVIQRAFPPGEADFAGVIAVVIGILLALIPVVLIDRLAKRVCGSSILDNLPFIP